MLPPSEHMSCETPDSHNKRLFHFPSRNSVMTELKMAAHLSSEGVDDSPRQVVVAPIPMPRKIRLKPEEIYCPQETESEVEPEGEVPKTEWRDTEEDNGSESDVISGELKITSLPDLSSLDLDSVELEDDAVEVKSHPAVDIRESPPAIPSRTLPLDLPPQTSYENWEHGRFMNTSYGLQIAYDCEDEPHHPEASVTKSVYEYVTDLPRGSSFADAGISQSNRNAIFQEKVEEIQAVRTVCVNRSPPSVALYTDTTVTGKCTSPSSLLEPDFEFQAEHYQHLRSFRSETRRREISSYRSSTRYKEEPLLSQDEMDMLFVSPLKMPSPSVPRPKLSPKPTNIKMSSSFVGIPVCYFPPERVFDLPDETHHSDDEPDVEGYLRPNASEKSLRSKRPRASSIPIPITKFPSSDELAVPEEHAPPLPLTPTSTPVVRRRIKNNDADKREFRLSQPSPPTGKGPRWFEKFFRLQPKTKQSRPRSEITRSHEVISGRKMTKSQFFVTVDDDAGANVSYNINGGVYHESKS